jgi:hypothetical protein
MSPGLMIATVLIATDLLLSLNLCPESDYQFSNWLLVLCFSRHLTEHAIDAVLGRQIPELSGRGLLAAVFQPNQLQVFPE